MPANMSKYGKIPFGGDFMHFEDNIAATGVASGIVWGTGLVALGSGLSLVSVNEGSFAWTIDEPGGILAITTDTGDNDNAFVLAARLKPADGGCEVESRIKVNDVAAAGVAVYSGLAETLAFDTPVMAAEFATATMTYNGTGGMAGLLFDADATALDWRAFQGDAAAGGTGSGTTGVRANETMTADEWYVLRSEIDPAGTSRHYVGHKGGSNGQLLLVKEFGTAGITPTDVFYPTVGVENRSANAKIMEVDYLLGYGWRDWTVT